MKPEFISTKLRNIQLGYHHGDGFPLSDYERSLINDYRKMHERAFQNDELIEIFRGEAVEMKNLTSTLTQEYAELEKHFRSIRNLVEIQEELYNEEGQFCMQIEGEMVKFDEHHSGFTAKSQDLHSQVVASHQRYSAFLDDFENFEKEVEKFDCSTIELYKNFNLYEIDLDAFEQDIDKFRGNLSDQETELNLMCDFYSEAVLEFNQLIETYSGLLDEIKQLRVYMHLGIAFQLN